MKEPDYNNIKGRVKEMKKMNIWKKLSAMAVVSALLVSMCGITAGATGKAALAEQQAILAAQGDDSALAAEQLAVMERKNADAIAALQEKVAILERKQAEAAAVLAEKEEIAARKAAE